ncbi:C2 domain-containing protein 3 isoform X2 [Odontomachus brunneus]|uniref:C2 domain-containing protein 3 isoform X2 n=1 Tax=Odontomachus brunneus TaxID=486640 RepID=UPI0013F1E2C5|nr:C2 domain-containing protein 3 isoform X2 [Odontomachus brunneus]
MDTEIKLCKSLPPLVEGKVHGSLKLLIDEVLWVKKSPGAVTVVASWWGEHDSAQFRPTDSTIDVARTNKDTTEIYAIKTNATLFEDYIKNCETVELVVIVEETHKVIGIAHIGELFKIFTSKLYSQYIPILSNSGNKVGDVHVSLQLTYLAKFPNMQLKMHKSDKNQVNSHDLLRTIDNLQYIREIPLSFNKDIDTIKKNSIKPVKMDTFDTYKPILKDKRPEFQETRKKYNEMVTDKLVAQIVARAQRLRGAILKETYNEDPLALSDTSVNNESYSYVSAKNEAKLYEYILGNEMTSMEEKKALDTLRSTSPTPSLINLASKTITTCECDNLSTRLIENSPVKSNIPMGDALYKETNYTESKGTHPLDHVDSIRIFIESFTLSPAGYRRAKSTCLQYGTPLSLTYFVQYDTTFGYTRQMNTKSNKEVKFTRIYAKKQVGQVINFNYEGIHGISRYIIKRNFLLKFKIFVRQCNKKSPTELGYGSMNINDIVHTTNLSSTQRLTITNKGLKIGELEVTAELGCDHIHFGKEFMDIVISAKENIPVLEVNHLTSTNINNKYRSVTGTHSSKSSSRVSPVSTKRIECLTSDNNKDLITAKDIAERRERSLDNKKVDTSNPETIAKDKVLLHGLIYVAEGKDLPESNTYLICRAFWREDKATSQICSNTKNPFYHFCQLVPLIHGTELLERIRDNYIIIEVYSRQNNNGTDNLLGIAKLPVHQLYIAYRDPLVLPHLLLSKYPVISVDGWVNINDLVSGKSCGELLALVALGTAEQIALLEVSRGLRNTSIITQQTSGSYQCPISDDTNCAMSGRENSRTLDQNMITLNCKNQEIQTDISVFKDGRISESLSQEEIVLYKSANSSANACALHTNKISTDQSAQTEIDQTEEEEKDEEKIDKEELCLNRQNSNILSDDNDSCSPRNNFQLPIEMYRSVGVGAEYDEESDQQQTNVYNNHLSSSVTEEKREKDESNTSNSTFFRAVVEIECALHLPKIERLNKSVEPSTYVTFQNLTLKSGNQLNSYMITNIYPHNCNPKWNWRSDAKLPTELLLNNEKRLILKVWHLVDSDVTVINLEKDTVIGFAAVDLSVLMAGFPTISGWFHIIDFNGKCNGQIKINITPLDSLPSFGKFALISSTNLSECTNKDLPHTNWSYPFNTLYSNAEESNVQQTLSYTNQTQCVQDTNKRDESTCAANTDHSLENVSMSILSLSLKQKLNELNEITERLQSRLRDVTNTAFEDDFDSDFEINESSSENEYTDKRNAETSGPKTIASHLLETSQISKQCKTQSDQSGVINKEQTSFLIANNDNLRLESISNQSTTINLEATDTGYSSSSNTHPSQYSKHYQHQNPYDLTHNYLSDSSAEYPARGTKTHISHLLDKLSLDLPPKPPAGVDMPMKRDIINLFTKLREHRNNLQDKKENNRSVNTCSVPTQTDNISAQHAYTDATSQASLNISNVYVGESVSKPIEESQSRSKISTVIREELIAEENDDAEWDELTTYLISTNIRYRNLDGMVNPLFYQHLVVPDLQATSAISPEEEAIEQLDNRYAKSFSMAMNRGTNSTENNAVFPVDTQIKSRTTLSESEENADFLCEIPSGVPGNVSNIDVTVMHKSSDNDLTSGNSAESITTASFDKSSIQQVDVETENYCFAISKSSVPEVSRQAPDGGNPVEEVKTVATKRQDDEDVKIISDQLKFSDT